MDRNRRIVPYALFGAGLGVVAAVLVFLAWTLDFAQAPALRNDEDLLDTAAIDDTLSPQPNATSDAPSADDSLLGRTTLADLGTLPTADRLTVNITDPLGLLAVRHELRASGKGDLVCRQWRRDGDEFHGTWPDAAKEPAVVEFALQALRPEFVVAASAPLTPDPAGGWRADLDLSECAAFVEFVVTGAPGDVAACTLKALFQQDSAAPGTLDLSWTLQEPLIVVAPVPCTITTELNLANANPQAAQRSLFPILTAGKHRHEIPIASGSVRVVVHDPPGSSSSRRHTLLLELTPELARGGWFATRTLESPLSSEPLFALVPSGRYELSCYEQLGGGRTRIGSRRIEVGGGEALVEFRTPQAQRTLTVHHAAPSGTEIWLLRVGTPNDEARGALAQEGATTVEFQGLDADEWIVWARGAGQAASTLADTRWSQHSEATLGGLVPLTNVEVELPAMLRGFFQIRAVECGGRVVQHYANAGRPVRLLVLPGPLEIRAVHQSGLTAEAFVHVSDTATADAPLRIPLNFRAP
jgi:hypothetical protein